MEDEKKTVMSPSELFNQLTQKKLHATDAGLQELYVNSLLLAAKYKKTGQRRGAQKLQFYIKNYEREKKLIDAGINTYIYRSDIAYYIDHVTSDHVSIIELENYPREIPDEIVDTIVKYKNLFDQMYVLFTDYTEELENEVEEQRKKETDPILFGAFKDNSTNTVVERFYFLGDWEDEYCDLTLDRMINEVNEHKKAKIDHLISNPKDLEDLKNDLKKLTEVKNKPGTSENAPITITGGNSWTLNDNNPIYINPDYKLKKNNHFFANVRSFFQRSNK